MNRLLVKNLLLLSNCLLLLFIGCSPVSGYKLKETQVVKQEQVHTMNEVGAAQMYKTKITVYNKYYTGFITLKQTEPNVSHLVFTTELGMTMFDFKIQTNNVEPVYVFEPLNKPEIKKILTDDFKLIFLQNLINNKAEVYEKKGVNQLIYKSCNNNYKNYYKLDTTEHTVTETTVKKCCSVKQRVNYEYDMAKRVKHLVLKHKGLLRLQIEMTYMFIKI